MRSFAVAAFLLLVSTCVVEARRQQTSACGWVVHYDRWVPSFSQKQPYDAHPGDNVKLTGTHCLEACCLDPTCTGVALESSLEYQCYKYGAIPDDLNDPTFSKGESLDKFLARPREPAWSVFIKSTHGGSEVMPPALDALARRAAAAVPEPSAARLEASIDSRLRGAIFANQKCDWGVSYDTWRPSFQRGEFEHNDINGGAHCLDACCQDPTCEGVALESNEMFQCYKYAKAPTNLPSQKQLGDGKWLLEKRAAWSVFTKRPLVVAQAKPVAGAAVLTAKLPAPPTDVAASLRARSAPANRGVLHSLGVVAMVTMLITTLIYALTRVELVAKRIAKRTQNCPEAKGLLCGQQLQEVIS